MLASSASRRAVRCLLVLSLAVSASTSLAETEGPKIDWKQGPSTADLGGKVAELKVPEKFVFAGAEDTKRLMESFGNPADGTEVGFLAPADENESWFVVFEYHDVGFIKDADKEKIDADALLASIREGTEEANKVRKEKGKPFSIVAVAEGAISKEEFAAQQAAAARKKEKKAKDPEPELVYAERTLKLARQLELLTGLEARPTILGHLQRGGTPSAADRLLATRLGTAAADLIATKNYGFMIAARGESSLPVLLEEVAGQVKTVPPDHPWVESARSVRTNFGD